MCFAIFFNKELFQNPGLRVGSWSWVEQNRTQCDGCEPPLSAMTMDSEDRNNFIRLVNDGLRN